MVYTRNFEWDRVRCITRRTTGNRCRLEKAVRAWIYKSMLIQILTYAALVKRKKLKGKLATITQTAIFAIIQITSIGAIQSGVTIISDGMRAIQALGNTHTKSKMVWESHQALHNRGRVKK